MMFPSAQRQITSSPLCKMGTVQLGCPRHGSELAMKELAGAVLLPKGWDNLSPQSRGSAIASLFQIAALCLPRHIQASTFIIFAKRVPSSEGCRFAGKPVASTEGPLGSICRVFLLNDFRLAPGD